MKWKSCCFLWECRHIWR